MKKSLASRMREGGYDGYAYAYPHKTAYRALLPPISLKDAWQSEDKSSLFLYVHLPFCEMRCGFCNLFTTIQPADDFVAQTLAAIKAQSRVLAEAINPERIAQAAIGGGTPSFLSEAQLQSLFSDLSNTWPIEWQKIPTSFEASPGTLTPGKLALLRSLGVDRISLGVQSFLAEDLVALKRPQRREQVEQVCQWIKNAGFPVFNIDLIYGNEGQDAHRWQRSLDAAIEWLPEEIYIYPLYIGKLTNLDRSGRKPGEHRRELCRQARDFLLGAGYCQVSMRLFRRADVVRRTDYCCQDDGMLGLGPGARSYTRSLHYSTEYAVGQSGVKSIIKRFNSRNPAEFAMADYGVSLSVSEQKVRYVIKSLLRSEGIALAAYQGRFGVPLHPDFPQLCELFDLELANEISDVVRLNAEGFIWSDTIGPWLYSEAVTSRMSAYEFA
jgi:oxygen-independent coproporphyrinogen-3 oxidase